MSKFLTKTRKMGFNLIDKLSGNKINNAIEEIKFIDSNDSLDPKVKNKTNLYLKKILEHASSTTEFYSNYSAQNGIDDFPVINKNLIKENYKDFLSTTYKTEKLYTMSTSGSTGSPFTVYQNEDKKRRVNAEIIYYSKKAGYDVGSKLVYLRALTTKTKKSMLLQWIQNEDLVNVSDLNPKKIKEILSYLETQSKREPITILTYASTLDIIKTMIDELNSYSFDNITGIISSSEILYDSTRKSAEKLFNTNVISRYSNQENGVIGQDDKDNNQFIINESSYYVEIFDMYEDKVLKEGEIGRIVVTDLFNKAMPIIRYDTGDIGAKVKINTNGRTKYAISRFGGRSGDIVTDIYGNRLSPHSIGNNMAKFSNIKQYQFIQNSNKDYLIKIISNEDINVQEITKLLQSILGIEANISIKIVDNIPAMLSGKRKYIINNT